MGRPKKPAPPPLRSCDFAMAIVKGIVEHNDATMYFGSLMGFAHHWETAKRHGWVDNFIRPREGETKAPESGLTEAGRDAYNHYKLATLPTIRYSRAYMWDWRGIPPLREEDIRL